MLDVDIAQLGVNPQQHRTTLLERRPQNCRRGCVSEYGRLLGSTGRVPAYSNCRTGCVPKEPHRILGYTTGLKWQCVEYARRWLLLERGLIFEEIETAADIWWHVDTIRRASDGRNFPLERFVNGAAEVPRIGDLLIYAREYLETGHVAVVTKIEYERGWVRVAEQNYYNRQWPGNYSRQIPLLNIDRRVWLLDPFLLGWKRPSTPSTGF